MAMTFSPIDAATLAALHAGDESAVERILRSNHAFLIERATERLKDEPAAAPRLVAQALRELWAERTTLGTSVAVEAFLNEELRNRASAVRSRMAAVHRFEKAEGVKAAAHAAPTVDQLWDEVRASLHRAAVDPKAAAKARRDHAKHDAAEHIAHVAERRSLKVPLIIGVVGALAILGGYWYLGQSSRESVILEMLAAAESSAVATRPGQLGSIALGDGSTARLGADTKLVAVAEFGRRYRTVAVEGTAAFTVAPGNDASFEARVGDAIVDAGTAGGTLLVRGYGEDSVRFVRAEDGTVRVRAPGGTRTLAAGEAVAIDATGAVRDASEAELAQAFSWADGRLVLRDVSVASAARQLLRWYGTQVDVPDSVVMARRLSLDVPLESWQAAQGAVEGGANVRFLWEKDRMVFRDAAAVGPARSSRRAAPR